MRNKLPWPKTQSEAEDLWRARIKYELLADKLTLSKDGKIPDAKKLNDSKAKIGRRYERLLKTMKEYERDDILETYLSALARAYDPHSDYMSPIEAKNFDINISAIRLVSDFHSSAASTVSTSGDVLSIENYFPSKKVLH